MIDINNKVFRKKLIAKYLDAETSLTEERMLVDYYLGNMDVDEDEQAFAQMIRMENIHASLLSGEGVEEFDRIVNGKKQEFKRIPLRWMTWVSGIAASIALLFAVIPSSQMPETSEIAQSIQQVMNLGMDDFVSITATPIDKCIWVKVELENGEKKTFIMEKDKEMGTTSLLAIN